MWAIGHQHDGFDAQILEDHRSACILAGICSVAQLYIRFGLRQPLLLESTAAHQGQMPIGSTLLIEPDDDASALLLDHRLRQLHLLAAVALDAVEDMRGDTV